MNLSNRYIKFQALVISGHQGRPDTMVPVPEQSPGAHESLGRCAEITT